MAVSPKYGYVVVQHEPGNPFGDDEPVFIIRGRDGLATAVMREYVTMCELGGSPPEHIQDMNVVITHMELWQAENEDDVKVPD